MEHYLRSPSDDRLFSPVIEITNECNLRCPQCFVQAGRIRASTLPRERLLKLLDEMYELGAESVKILGGEPLLHPSLVKDVILHARRIGLYTSIETNGSLLTEELARLFSKYEVFTSMTIYAGSREGYRQFGGEELFPKVVEGLSILPTIHFHQLRISVLRINMAEFDKMIQLAERCGVRYVTLQATVKIGRAPVRVQNLEIPPRVIGELLRKIEEKFEAINDPRNALPRARNIIPYCFAVKNNPYVDAYGDVYPCLYSLYPPFKLGNIHEKPLKEILQQANDKLMVKEELLKEGIRPCDSESLTKIATH